MPTTTARDWSERILSLSGLEVRSKRGADKPGKTPQRSRAVRGRGDTWPFGFTIKEAHDRVFIDNRNAGEPPQATSTTLKDPPDTLWPG
jgi:hypothetical protein